MENNGWTGLALLLSQLFPTFINVILLGAVPVVIYAKVQKRRHGLTDYDVAERVGLRRCESRYVWYAIAFSVAAVTAQILWSPDIEQLTQEKSPQGAFTLVGVGAAIPAALFYGILRTGFPQELLFRGLIAGSLARHMRFAWANIIQAAIFLLPHLLLLFLIPDFAWYLPFVFGLALILGWLRIRSGSIIPSWIVLASWDTTTCLIVAAQSGN